MTIPVRQLRLEPLCEFLGLSRSTIYRWIELGEFPKPVHVGPKNNNCVVWLVTEIAEWQQKQIAARNEPLPEKPNPHPKKRGRPPGIKEAGPRKRRRLEARVE